MPSKNDLSGLKFEEKKILPEPVRTPEVESVRVRTRKRVGRPKKAATDKRDYKITLSLTQAEGAKVSNKAGLVNEATYLYAMLEKTGLFR
jgi:hypothetical protein